MTPSFLADADDAPSKREILACALELFVREGLAETSIRAIADASGYTNPALYKFFASKEALARHLFERCYRLVYERVKQATESGDFAQQLTGLVQAWVALMNEQLPALLFMNENLRDFWPRLPAKMRQHSLLERLEQWLERGQLEGVVSSTLPTMLAVAMVVGTLGQVARQRFFGAFRGDDLALSLHLSSLLHAALTTTEFT